MHVVVKLTPHNLRQVSAGEVMVTTIMNTLSEICLIYANNAAKSAAEMIRVALW
jgi:hypothetical protein